MMRIDEAELEAKLSSSTKPIAAAFVRTGSAPADALLAALKHVRDDRYDVVELDVDACAALQQRLRIHHVPELLVWAPPSHAHAAKLVARTEGSMTREQIADLLEHAITRM